MKKEDLQVQYVKSEGIYSVHHCMYMKDGGGRLMSFEFKKVLVEPCVVDSKDWMKQFVYASHLVKHGNKLRLYFNARDTSDMLKGRECIGFAEAEI